MDYIQIGKNIRYYRKKHNLTLQELSTQITCSLKHLGNIERGSARPSLECLYEIAQTLQVSLDLLITSPHESRCNNYNLTPLLTQYLETQQKELQCFLNHIHALSTEENYD